MQDVGSDTARLLGLTRGTSRSCKPKIRRGISEARLAPSLHDFAAREQLNELLKHGLYRGVAGVGLLPAFRSIFAGRAAILMFHEIQRNCRSELMTGTSVELFEYSLSWLQRKGWAIVSLEECLERLARNDRSRRYAVLTFDDGYRDNVSAALPILERYNAPFMMYVPTTALTRTMHCWWLALRELVRSREEVTIDAMGMRLRCPDLRSKQLVLRKVDRWVHQDYNRAVSLAATFNKAGISISALNDRYFLDSSALQRLARHPLVSIGGHTKSHEALAILDASSARVELVENRNYLESLLQLPVRHLAYPYGTPGACGPRDEHLAKEVGYLSAATTRHGQLGDHQLNQFALPRIGVSSSFDSEISFAARMSGVQLALHRLGGWLSRN